MKETKIVIVEDDEIFREAFRLLVNSSSHYEVVNTYNNCEEALENILIDNPSIVVMDIHLPGMNGIEGTRKIKSLNSRINILIISATKDKNVTLQAFAAGAIGFMTKDAEYIDFMQAIRVIGEGGAPMSKNVSRLLVESFHQNYDSPLSTRETQVIQLLSQGNTYKTIADLLFIHPETVKSHLKNISSKLNVHNKADALMKALHDRLITHE